MLQRLYVALGGGGQRRQRVNMRAVYMIGNEKDSYRRAMNRPDIKGARLDEMKAYVWGQILNTLERATLPHAR